MLLKTLRFGALGPVAFLAGCSFATESLWPSFGFGNDEQETEVSVLAPAPEPEAATAPELTPPPPPQLGQTIFAPPAVTQAITTGTFVGQKVAQHRAELVSLQGIIVERNNQLQGARQQATADSQRYHGTIAAINAPVSYTHLTLPTKA